MHLPTCLMATSVPRCHVLVRFLPKSVMSSLMLSCFKLGFGCVGAFLGPEDINTAGTAKAPWVCVEGALADVAIPDGVVLLTVWARFCTC